MKECDQIVAADMFHVSGDTIDIRVFVAYYASAELGCYRVLGWPMPERCRPYHMLQRTRIFSNDYFVATKHAGDSRADDRGMFIGDQNRLESDLTATASNRSWQRNLAAKKP